MFHCNRITAILVIAVFASVHSASAQSDDVSLGDLARNLRKNQPPPRTVIDNDNLPAVMEQGENKRWHTGLHSPAESSILKIVNSSSPDVSCALSFDGQRDLAAESFHPEKVPETELSKLDGPAMIANDSLQVSVHNGSGWELREITVSLTLVQHRYDALNQLGGLRLMPATMSSTSGSEKRPDTTVLFHMKGTAAPSSTTLFQAPLGITVSPDQEWHWAIVQAKGIPPVSTSAPPTEPLTAIQAPN
jgi:hypothetical protein